MARDPALRMIEKLGRWFVEDVRAGGLIGSPADDDPAQDGDIAYLARHQVDGRIVVHIAGVHAIGSLGAAHYLTGHLAELFTQAGEQSFSAVIRSTFDGLTITGSELAAGPYTW